MILSIYILNPKAKFIEYSFSKVDPNKILNTGLFDFEEAEMSAGWIEELNKDGHNPETEEYGIGSFVFRSKKPFHPDRFLNYIQSSFPSTVIRSKGLFWMASRPDEALSWSQAGGSLRADGAGVWWSSMSFEERIRYAPFVENQEVIESGWDKTYGDRKNELVFIGQEMDEEKIVKDLNECLLSDQELEEIDWETGFEDSWPLPRLKPLVGE